MKTKEINPLEPFVTVEQIMAFNPNLPETHTESRIINEICKAFIHLGWAVPTQAVADYLGLDLRDLSGAVRVITGMKFPALRKELCHSKVLALHAAHPSWDADKIAHAMGYRDRASLFHLLGRKEYDKFLATFVTSE